MKSIQKTFRLMAQNAASGVGKNRKKCNLKPKNQRETYKGIKNNYKRYRDREIKIFLIYN